MLSAHTSVSVSVYLEVLFELVITMLTLIAKLSLEFVDQSKVVSVVCFVVQVLKLFTLTTQ